MVSYGSKLNSHSPKSATTTTARKTKEPCAISVAYYRLLLSLHTLPLLSASWEVSRALALPGVARTPDLNAPIPAKCGGRKSAFFYLRLAFVFLALGLFALRMSVVNRKIFCQWNNKYIARISSSFGPRRGVIRDPETTHCPKDRFTASILSLLCCSLNL